MIQDPGAAGEVIPIIGSCFILFIALAISVLQVVVFCMIYSRAGYSWAMGLLMLIPVVNFIMMLVLAFSEWPVQRQLKELRQQMSGQVAPTGTNFRSL